jgi:hypothetical protein
VLQRVLIFCCILEVLCRETIPHIVSRSTIYERSLLLVFDRGNEVVASDNVSAYSISNGFKIYHLSFIIQFLNGNRNGFPLKLINIASSNI